MSRHDLRPRTGAAAGRAAGAGAYGLPTGRDRSTCSTSRRTRPTGSTSLTAGRSRCASTAPATTPPPRSSPSSPGSTPCARDGVVTTPHVVPGSDGSRVHAADDARASGSATSCSSSGCPADAEPTARLLQAFRALGAVTARMHGHAQRGSGRRRSAASPGTTTRTLGAPARWGRWQDGIGVGPAEREAARPARRDAAARLARFRHAARSGSAWSTPTSGWPTCWSTGPTCASSTSTTAASAGSCTTSRTTVSLLRAPPAGPRADGRLGRGLPLASRSSIAADEAEIDTFVMLRRLLLVAWIGSHHRFATEAAELGAGFTEGSCALAEQYLSNQ